MINIQTSFQNKKAFIPFVTANDPNMKTMVKSVNALADGGADLIEIGIPFSDPIADGPVIQRADLRALQNNQFSIDDVFNAIQKIREHTEVPIVFLTYLNIILQYGYEDFCKQCQKNGVQGLIIPDLPYESKGELKPYADKYQIDLIPLITLTSGDRIEKIAKDASGFIYLVSSLGVTGEREHFSDKIASVVKEIKKYTNVPVAIGFGIHSPEQARFMSNISDGAIVGSACVKIIEKYKEDAPQKLKEFTQKMKSAVEYVE